MIGPIDHNMYQSSNNHCCFSKKMKRCDKLRVFMEVKLVWRFKVNLPKFEHIDMYRLGVLHIKLANDHGDFSKK